MFNHAALPPSVKKYLLIWAKEACLTPAEYGYLTKKGIVAPGFRRLPKISNLTLYVQKINRQGANFFDIWFIKSYEEQTNQQDKLLRSMFDDFIKMLAAYILFADTAYELSRRLEEFYQFFINNLKRNKENQRYLWFQLNSLLSFETREFQWIFNYFVVNWYQQENFPVKIADSLPLLKENIITALLKIGNWDLIVELTKINPGLLTWHRSDGVMPLTIIATSQSFEGHEQISAANVSDIVHRRTYLHPLLSNAAFLNSVKTVVSTYMDDTLSRFGSSNFTPYKNLSTPGISIPLFNAIFHGCFKNALLLMKLGVTINEIVCFAPNVNALEFAAILLNCTLFPSRAFSFKPFLADYLEFLKEDQRSRDDLSIPRFTLLLLYIKNLSTLGAYNRDLDHFFYLCSPTLEWLMYQKKFTLTPVNAKTLSFQLQDLEELITAQELLDKIGIPQEFRKIFIDVLAKPSKVTVHNKTYLLLYNYHSVQKDASLNPFSPEANAALKIDSMDMPQVTSPITVVCPDCYSTFPYAEFKSKSRFGFNHPCHRAAVPISR